MGTPSFPDAKITGDEILTSWPNISFPPFFFFFLSEAHSIMHSHKPVILPFSRSLSSFLYSLFLPFSILSRFLYSLLLSLFSLPFSIFSLFLYFLSLSLFSLSFSILSPFLYSLSLPFSILSFFLSLLSLSFSILSRFLYSLSLPFFTLSLYSSLPLSCPNHWLEFGSAPYVGWLLDYYLAHRNSALTFTIDTVDQLWLV